jgi:DNA polymerase I
VLEIRRAFTVFQLMTILEEARHFLIIVEHDPMLYENAQEMVEYVSQGLHDAAKEAQSCFTHLEPILSWRI